MTDPTPAQLADWLRHRADRATASAMTGSARYFRLAADLIETRTPRVIETTAELDALPEEAAVSEPLFGVILQKGADNKWFGIAHRGAFPPPEVPCILIWQPGKEPTA